MFIITQNSAYVNSPLLTFYYNYDIVIVASFTEGMFIMSPDVIVVGTVVFGVVELALSLWIFSRDKSPDPYGTRMHGVIILTAIGLGVTLTPGYLLALHIFWALGLGVALAITGVLAFLARRLVAANNKTHSS